MVSVRSNNCKLINLLNKASEGVNIHTITILIDTEAKSTTYLLTFLCRRAAAVFKSTYLKNIVNAIHDIAKEKDEA